MDFNAIFSQILMLFLILFLGFFVRKREIIDDYTSKKISSLIVNVTAPLLIIDVMSKKPQFELRDIINILSMAIIVYTVLFLMTIIVPKLLKIEKDNIGVYKFMIMFSNVGFMGFPVVSSIFGAEAVFYAAIFNLPFELLVYTLGVYFVSLNNKDDVKFNFKKIINPCLVAVIFGLFLFTFKLELPLSFAKTVSMVGGLTTPLAMMVIGASLADVTIKKYFLI